jgi:hypothetical protein
MPEPKKEQPKTKPENANKPRPAVPGSPGRDKRGSELRDADLLDAPVEDPDEPIAD